VAIHVKDSVNVVLLKRPVVPGYLEVFKVTITAWTAGRKQAPIIDFQECFVDSDTRPTRFLVVGVQVRRSELKGIISLKHA
jgi:hypothetical protein